MQRKEKEKKKKWLSSMPNASAPREGKESDQKKDSTKYKVYRIKKVQPATLQTV